MLTATREDPSTGTRIVPLEMGRRPRSARQPSAQQPVRDPDEQLRDLVDAFLHDTNGSLFVAAEFAELLAEGTQGDLNKEQQRLLQIIHDRTYTVHDILESLHWAVKLRTGGGQFMPRPSSVQELLDLTVPRLLRRARSKVGEFHTTVCGTPPTMRCDPSAASLILVNLFTHVSCCLNTSHSVTLQVESLPGGRHNTFRFIVASGQPPLLRREPSIKFNAYFDLAIALAHESNGVILDADEVRGHVLGLAIPTDATDDVFPKSGE